MTGGRVVVLGKTGRNFGAGMSGGVAYVWDKDGDFERMCNTETFELESLDAADDISELRTLITNHQKYTGSTVAEHILNNWKSELTRFVKVMPTDYKRVLEEISGENVVTAAVGS
jgi:glutamate synthase domain-containing protein 3